MNRCIGCGTILQDTNPSEDGYVYSDELSLCMRCFKIKNYGENLKIDKTNDDYIKILEGINDDDICIVLIISKFIPAFREDAKHLLRIHQIFVTPE